jgi:metal-sulfur cluster biosynthetic enzyme
MATALDNANPVIHARETLRRRDKNDENKNQGGQEGRGSGSLAGTFGFGTSGQGGLSPGDKKEEREPIDSIEVFEHVRDIADPEHPYSLEQLGVVSHEHIKVDDENGVIDVFFTPTVAHCSMATLIGLCIRAKIMRVLPPRFKVR